MTARTCYGARWFSVLAFVVVLSASSGVFAQEHDRATFVSTLPELHTTIMYGGVRYFCVDHTYYRWNTEKKKYEVVAPPPGYESAITGQPAADGELYVYARSEVPPGQQLNDRYECSNYATRQSGYDLTKEDGGVPADVEPAKRADYFRAEAACLDARGYRVR